MALVPIVPITSARFIYIAFFKAWSEGCLEPLAADGEGGGLGGLLGAGEWVLKKPEHLGWTPVST